MSESMADIVAVCEQSRPHPDWTTLRDLDWDDGAAHVRDWLQEVFEREPPDDATRGLWFGVNNPGDGEGVRSDIYLAGFGGYDPGDAELAWLVTGPVRYHPQTTPRPPCLKEMYAIAYHAADGLQNDAEYPLALVFGCVAVARALSAVRLPQALRRDQPLGVAVGFDGGDLLFLGELGSAGFNPRPSV